MEVTCLLASIGRFECHQTAFGFVCFVDPFPLGLYLPILGSGGYGKAEKQVLHMHCGLTIRSE